MRFLISLADGSFSPPFLLGPEAVDIDDIAESIEDVRGIVACTRGSTFECWEDVEEEADRGLGPLYGGFETGPVPGLVLGTFSSLVSRTVAGTETVCCSVGVVVDFAREPSGFLSPRVPMSCDVCTGKEGMVGDGGFEVEGVVGAEPTPLELDRGGRVPSDPR